MTMQTTVPKNSVVLDIIFTVITFGLFNLWVQVRQIADVNEILGEDRFSFFWMAVFSLLTIGLYFCYHEYKLTYVLEEKVIGKASRLNCIASAVSALLGLWFLTDSYQQLLINRYVEMREHRGTLA